MDHTLTAFIGTTLAMGVLFYLTSGPVPGSGNRIWYSVMVGIGCGAIFTLSLVSLREIDRIYDSREVSSERYREMRLAAASDPRIKEMVRKVMHDGKISNAEYDRVAAESSPLRYRLEVNALRREMSRP